jgi:hypothetical protein
MKWRTIVAFMLCLFFVTDSLSRLLGQVTGTIQRRQSCIEPTYCELNLNMNLIVT